jgi:hypothetical protein
MTVLVPELDVEPELVLALEPASELALGLGVVLELVLALELA